MNLGLTGRVVFVTGGSRGIGRATAEMFSEEGARVAMTYRHNRAEAEVVVDALTARGADACVEFVDLGTPESIRAAVAAVLDRWGRLDVLVNNAVEFIPIAAAYSGPFEDFPALEWQRLVRVNIESAFAAIQSVLPPMRRGAWGRIVNVSSVAAEDGMPKFAWYSAAKAGLHGLTKTLAKELGPAGILINAVMPGGTLTERVRNNIAEESLRQQAETLPIRRLPTPVDVATAVVFLCSAANTAITGEILRASGGRREVHTGFDVKASRSGPA
jgi:3-oxoacyl-[acyl-carrier protein] reductase